MVKILLLNPHIDAEHSIVRTLQGRGHGVLICSDPKQASEVLKLHKRTVELAIIHREDARGSGEPGLSFLQSLRQDQEQRDLPCAISSAVWGPADFASHQSGPLGAHAYLPFPATGDEYLKIVDGIFANAAPLPPAAPGVFLETAFSQTDLTPPTGLSSIHLELPDPPSEPTSLPPRLSAPTAARLQEIESSLSMVELSESSASDFQGNGDREAKSGSVALNRGVELSFDGESGVEGPDAPFDISTRFAEPSSLELPTPPETPSSSRFTHAPATSGPEQPLESDPIVAQEMPYLFDAPPKAQQPELPPLPPLDLLMPMGDAIVPGGAAQTPDVETLKKYLLLREQDVAALSTQLKGARDQVGSLEDQLRQERGRSTDLQHQVEARDRKIQEFEREKALALEGLQAEIDELKFHARAKSDRSRHLESQVREAASEMEHLKDRVRSDIRKIRVREKELENRLEILKKDSEALISARENKIIELKRKVDLLEFNMDLLQDQYQREKDGAAKTRERLARALQAVRVAGGLLDGGKPAVSDESREGAVSAEGSEESA